MCSIHLLRKFSVVGDFKCDRTVKNLATSTLCPIRTVNNIFHSIYISKFLFLTNHTYMQIFFTHI